MSENFAEDEESKNSLIKKGTFKEEGNEQNDLMMDDPNANEGNMGIPKDSQQAYDKMIADSQKRTESFSHNPRAFDDYDTIKQLQRRAAPAPSSQVIARRSAIGRDGLE